jgi:hypothetical protein
MGKNTENPVSDGGQTEELVRKERKRSVIIYTTMTYKKNLLPIKTLKMI